MDDSGDFTVSLANASDPPFAVLDTVSWLGSVVLGVDISSLTPGSFGADNSFNGMTMNLNISAVPEPATTGLFALGCVGFLARRRRRKRLA